MCFVRGSGRRSRRKRRMRNVKESRRVTGLQGEVHKNTCARTTQGPQKGPLGLIDGSEQLQVSKFPLDSRRCLVLPPLPLTTRFVVFGISRRRPGSFHQCSPRRDFEPLDPIQASSCEGGASEMFSFWDPLQLIHEVSHHIRVPLENHGETIRPTRPEGT